VNWKGIMSKTVPTPYIPKKKVNLRQVLQGYKSNRFSIEIKIKDKKNIKTEHCRLGQLFLMIRIE
jgi:hypothetical protein